MLYRLRRVKLFADKELCQPRPKILTILTSKNTITLKASTNYICAIAFAAGLYSLQLNQVP